MESSNESLKSQAVGGSSWEAISSITQRIGGLIFTIILARFLLPEGFGLYNLALSITLIFFVFAQGGFDKSLARYISESLKLKDDKKKVSYFHYILKLKAVILILISVLLTILAYPISIYLFKKPALFAPILLATLYNFFYSIERFFTSFFIAMGKVKYRAFKEIIYQISRIILIFIAFFLIYLNPSVINTFWILILSSFITLLFVLYKIYNLSPDIFKRGIKSSDKDKKRILKFTFYITFTSITILLLGSVDTLMLGLLVKDSIYIGLYNSAFFLVASISGLLSFSEILLPIFVKSDKDKLENVFNSVLRYLLILSVPATFGLFTLGNYFIVLIYGYEYLGATLALNVLSLLILLSGPPGLFIELFSVKEKPKDYFVLTILIIILNILLNYLFIKFFLIYSPKNVIMGVALATLLSWVVYSIGMGILVKRRLNIKTKLSLVVKPLIASFVMVGIIYLLKSQFKDITILNGAILIICGIIVYFATLFAIKGINKEDYFIIEILKSKIFLPKNYKES